jgi:hypothetical protein
MSARLELEGSMNADNSVFAIYSETQVEDAVNELVANNFAKERISVLCPRNEATREFAARKGTHTPIGTDKGRYANVPLAGTLGILHPAEGPLLGALHDALIDMGVPECWCDRRVVHGKFLLSVLCHGTDEFFRAVGILRFKSAIDISWAVPAEKYWERAQNS